MKVSTQPLSAFAVYSEKLKQKKKKSKPQSSNGIKKKSKPQGLIGIKKNAEPHTTNSVKKKLKSQVLKNVNKFKKAQLSNGLNKPKNDVDKKTLEMKEIGYILRKLAEQSAGTSSPRTTALLNSISEANEKLEHDHTADNMYLEETLQNIIEVERLKKKARLLKDLNKKKVNKPVAETVLSDDFRTGHSKLGKLSTIENLAVPEKNCRPAESSTKTFLSSCDKSLDASKSKSSKLKKKKATFNEVAIGLNLKAELIKKNKLKLSPVEKLKKRKTGNQLEVMLKKRDEKKFQGKHKDTSSDSTAKQLFDWLIVPVSEKDFMSDFWEKKPLLIQREGNRNYFSELLSTERIDVMLRENNVCFTKHLDITSYTDGVRETHNLTGRAQASVVWDFYSNGCSVRMLNPQIFLPKIHTLNATLQEYFGCFVGANVYLTPPNSQGFAPHYDDIEAFVLQIEGKKHWKVYTPRTDKEVLPRLSSPNFSQEEIGEPFLEVTLEPGDLLYFPRGFIHQASTVEGEHSLHITLSAYQKTAWVDLLEKVLPIALKRAAEDDVEFRRGLPRDYLGLEYRGSPREKQSFLDTAQALIGKLGHYLLLNLGAGVDEMGAQFMHDALPPVFTPSEKQNLSVERGLTLKNGKLEGRVEFQMDTRIKLIRSNVCRVVEQEGEMRLYHCLDNPLEYHGDEPQFLVLPQEGVDVIDQLQSSYPAFIPISEIPHQDQEALITLISDLWETGLLSAEDLPVVEES